MKQTSTSKNLFVNRRKIQKIYNNKVYLSELEPGCNIACGIRELHAKQCRLQYRWENLNQNKKMEAKFKNLFTILDPYTHQGLSNHKTSSPI
jgi:hypothetical protein